MRHAVLVFGLIGALVAPSASAAPAQVGSWLRSCQTNQATQSLAPGSMACWTPAADESATPIIDVDSCTSVDFFQHDDFDGDATVCTAVHEIDMCPSGADILT